MWSLRRPWRGIGPARGRSPHPESIDGDSPVLELRRVAAHGVEVDALQLLRELPDLARAPPPAVDLDHRWDLGSGPGEEQLVACVKLGSVDAPLHHVLCHLAPDQTRYQRGGHGFDD